MCTVDCPCADVAEKSEWLSLSTEDLKANWPSRTAGFDFTGTYTSYSECIQSVENPVAEEDS